MAMTVPEMETFFAEQAEMFSAAVAGAEASKRYDLAATNLMASMSAWLMRGLLRWRRQAGSPESDIASAVDVAARAAVVLPSLDVSRRPGASFDFGVPLLLGHLIGRDGEELRTALSGSEDAVLPTPLDVALADVLCGRETPESLIDQTRSRAAEKRHGLLKATYDCYSRMLAAAAAGDVAALRAACADAATFFERRRRDSFFSGGRDFDGGGPDNALVVDFRLAAVILRCEMSFGVEGIGGEPHRWSWGLLSARALA